MRIGIGIWNQQPFIVRHTTCWRLWVSFNNDVTSGTYYAMHDDGTMDIVTVVDHDPVEIRRVNTK